MLVEEAVMRIKAAGRDSSFAIGVDRCIEFLNRSSYEVGSLLIANKYPNIVKTVELEDGDNIPANCMQLCGYYPIRITDGVVEFLDDVDKIKVRYFSMPGELTNTRETMPYKNDAINDIIIQGAIILALHENSNDITVDTQFKQSITEAVAAAMKA